MENYISVKCYSSTVKQCKHYISALLHPRESSGSSLGKKKSKYDETGALAAHFLSRASRGLFVEGFLVHCEDDETWLLLFGGSCWDFWGR